MNNSGYLCVNILLAIGVRGFIIETTAETAFPATWIRVKGFIPVVSVGSISPTEGSTFNFSNNAAKTTHWSASMSSPRTLRTTVIPVEALAALCAIRELIWILERANRFLTII